MESTFDSCFQLAVTQNQIDNDLYRLYNGKKVCATRMAPACGSA